MARDRPAPAYRPEPAADPERHLALHPLLGADDTGRSGGTPIPPDGAILVARGTSAQRLTEEAPLGTPVTIRLLLNPDWSGIAEALGGGPVLVREGKPVFRHLEAFTPVGEFILGSRTS